MFILLLLFMLLDIFNNTGTLKNIRLLLVICLSVLIVGFIFKILHWKGADLLLLTGHAFAVLFYLTQIVLRNFKPMYEIAKTVFIIVLAMASITKILHWAYALELSILALAAFLIYFGMLAYKFFVERNQKTISPPCNENNL